MAFIGLVAFIGLAVDAGILFTQIGHLRRAVDAAALAAANQFREGRSPAELDAAATEFINLNNVTTGTAFVKFCADPFLAQDPPISVPAENSDPTLCPTGGQPHRKFVRVEAEVIVHFAFLPIIGFTEIPIHADAVSETAAVDLVLVIDTSSSMAFDLCSDGLDNDEDGVPDDCPSIANAGPLPGENAVEIRDGLGNLVGGCNLNATLPDDDGPGEDAGQAPPDGDREDDCHPFEEVRAASEALLSRMYFPYDRMAVVTFSREGSLKLSLALGDDETTVLNTIGRRDPYISGLEVSPNPFVTGQSPCDFAGSGGDPRGCPNTNPADGLVIGGNLFADPNADGTASPGEIRQEAVWIMILLSDGAANSLYDTSTYPLTDRNAWICPGALPYPNPNWMEPWCGDIDPSNTTGRHAAGTTWYDPDDAARDMADFVGCPDANSPQPVSGACAEPGQGAVVFTIGLGDEVENTRCDAFYGVGPTCGNLGEMLLRYIAGAGDDNDPGTPAALDPCNGVASGNDCGNYYFAPSGAGLLRVFEAIASRIFTRLTH